jgi:hypothetical protein
MDVADFEFWLSWIAALTVPQRRRAWQALALSEASDGSGDEVRAPLDLTVAGVDLTAPSDRSITMPLPPAQPSNRD